MSADTSKNVTIDALTVTAIANDMGDDEKAHMHNATSNRRLYYAQVQRSAKTPAHMAHGVAGHTLLVRGFERFVEDQMRQNDASHDIVHVTNVVHNFTDITRDLPAFTPHMRLVGHLVALGHELCDRKYTRDGDKERILSAVRQSLRGLGFTSSVESSVVRILPLISFTRRMEHGVPDFLFPDECMIFLAVSDADMLEAIGIVGFVRTFMFQAHTGSDTMGALRYVEDVLLSCEEYMEYPWSKAEAAKRTAAMRVACLAYREERRVL